MSDPRLLRERCESLDDLDLACALTLERDDHDEAFLAEAEAELGRRGTSLDGVLDRVSLQVGPDAARETTVAEALEMVRDDVPRRAVAGFTRCLGDTLLLQREGWGWVCHHYRDAGYHLSYLIDGTATTRQTLERFLRLQDWHALAGGGHHLDDWKPLVADEDVDTVLMLADRLHSAGLPHVVRPTVFTPEGDNTVALLVPPERLREATESAGTGRAPVRRLYQRATQLDDAGDLRGELAVYDELIDVDDDNHAVHYNRGAVLLELERYEEAAQAFMEAVGRGLGGRTPSLAMGRGPTGGGGLGLFGVAARLFGRAAGTATAASYPDWLDDAELQLDALHRRLGARLDLLHSLAALARAKGDTEAAATRYRAVLELAPDDEVARQQLQFLTDDDDAPHSADLPGSPDTPDRP